VVRMSVLYPQQHGGYLSPAAHCSDGKAELAPWSKLGAVSTCADSESSRCHAMKEVCVYVGAM
jgi:hypothetical protein